jgi:monoamine oxidase
VTTKEAGSYYARTVIVTLPLGVLKAGSVQFSPPLSANKTEAIAKIGVGLIDKVVLTFAKKFWSDSVYFDR